jgi:nickel/cobalt transporter (NicO) family protein
MKKLIAFLLVCAAEASAHPMGNFSVSHYAKLKPTASGIELQYALDLAEIPTFELLRSWGLNQDSPRAELEKHAREQAREWVKHLSIILDGSTASAKFESASLVIANGAGSLPIIRVTAQAHINARRGVLEYEDRNFPDRAGWKEIVIDTGGGASLVRASQSHKDISKALTQYPPDPTIAPPQDVRAELEWAVKQPVIHSQQPLISPVSQPKPAHAAPAPVTTTKEAAPLGAVARGDFLSTLLQQRQLTPWMIFVALVCAFALGAAHALTPGHGKSIVAAYLVGSRGTLKHAAFLGAMVTLTHTISVFALGIATLFLFRYIVPEKITEILGVISGISIVAVGAWMLYKRVAHASACRGELQFTVPHHHPHSHSHTHHHHHDHVHTHSHIPDEISWGGLVALGASGGLVPCESALVLLLGAIALDRVGLGLLLLVSFSLGLALVLMAIGVLVLYARNLLPELSWKNSSPLLRWASIVSPAVVIVVGLVMTGVSLGWIHPNWMIG